MEESLRNKLLWSFLIRGAFGDLQKITDKQEVLAPMSSLAVGCYLPISVLSVHFRVEI